MDNTKTFIIKALLKFGNKFNYEKSVYTKSTDFIIITCPIHGDFKTTPKKFLASKFGCPKCAIDQKQGQKITTKEWILKAKEIHGDKYTYSNTVFSGSANNITITCPKHGNFVTKASRFLQGHGCPKCKGDITREINKSKRDTLEQFIQKVINLYGKNIFNFDLVKYINSRTNVIIYSNISNEYFEITPARLLSKNIKKKHYGGKIITLNLSNDEYIKSAIKIHGNNYNYNNTKYISMKDSVTVTCPIHGNFNINASNHLNGLGCPKCGKIKIGKSHRKSFKEFVKDARIVHGDKYDYIENSFIKSSSKLTIICPKHGEFQQLAHAHISGLGCPMCNNSKGENILKNYFDKNNIKYITQYPINIDKNINSSGLAYIDFYLPDYNIAIEYNGELHYKYIPYFHRGRLIDLEHQQKRDKCVYNYCEINNIKLIIFKYTELKILEKLIENELKNRSRFG